jgi:hypothetical protein
MNEGKQEQKDNKFIESHRSLKLGQGIAITMLAGIAAIAIIILEKEGMHWRYIRLIVYIGLLCNIVCTIIFWIRYSFIDPLIREQKRVRKELEKIHKQLGNEGTSDGGNSS